MRRKTKTFRVGLVVIGTGLMFLGLTAFIVGSSLGNDLVTYEILFEESVKGMVHGSKVNFQGIPVGMVSDIRFERGNTRVQIDIDPEKAVIQDVTRARMDRLLITGQVTVELGGYDAAAKTVPPGALIPAGVSAFDEFAQSLPEVVADADDLLVALTKLTQRLSEVFDESNREALASTLGHLERASRSLAEDLPPVLAETRATVAGLAPAVRRMESSFAAVGAAAGGEDLRQALRGFRTAMHGVDRVESEVLALVGDLRGLLGSSRSGWFGTLGMVRQALDEVRMLARNLRLAPSSLVFGRAGNEITVSPRPLGGDK